MKILDLVEAVANQNVYSWMRNKKYAEIRRALISTSQKLKQLVDSTAWLRVGYEDGESGQHYYGDYLRRYEGNGPEAWVIRLLGKHIPIDNELNFADLIDADSETNKKIRDRIEKRSASKRLTAKDVEKINQKSLRLMQGVIGTLAKTKFHSWTDDEGVDKTIVLDHVEWYTGSHYAKVKPETAAENLSYVYPKNKEHIEYFGRELYAPHVALYFRIKSL